MERRTMLSLVATSVAAALSACAVAPPEKSPATGSPSPVPTGLTPTLTPTTPPPATPSAAAGKVFSAPQGIKRFPIPHGNVNALPGQGNLIALTIDDGNDPKVLRAYADLAKATGIRLSFFVNGVTRGWTDHKAILRELVDENVAYMGNHTYSHPWLTKISSAQVGQEITKNEQFLMNTYGVTGRPFLRPPFGAHNAGVRKVMADLGYPANTLWLGSLGDAGPISAADLRNNATQWFKPQHLVIGHANHPPVIEQMEFIVETMKSRNLVPVHLGDVFEVDSVYRRA